jgi:hypothetical protein
MDTVDSDALTGALQAFYSRPLLQCPVDTSLKYNVNTAFRGAPYWVGAVRSERFELTLAGGILYRQEIVDDIQRQIVACLEKPVTYGIMVKGPQGIGKSHSLVNAVLKLESTGEYLVTFIPDCEQWISADHLLTQICASFGSTPKAVGIPPLSLTVGDYPPSFLASIIGEIDTQLQVLGKKWVFVFDQINKLFVKPINTTARDASGLAFPFVMIKSVMKTGRITSVISASANNEVAYKERHEGFLEYIHRSDMTHSELQNAFATIPVSDIEQIVALTGGVPLHVSLLLTNGEDSFRNEIDASVKDSLRLLRGAQHVDDWKLICQSVFASLLKIKTSAGSYDKKFFIASTEAHNMFKYEALLPPVLESCREFLWRDLMVYVQEKEQSLLSVCTYADTTNDARGRHFENMVIRRCVQDGVTFQVGGESISIPSPPSLDFLFHGKKLPTFTPQTPNGVYVPLDPNFPAIDLVWKHNTDFFGVQVHVSTHDDCMDNFVTLCRSANLFGHFNVHLIYLSPEDDVMNLVQNLVAPPTMIVSERTTRSNGNLEQLQVQRRAISKNSVACLVDLLWPEGCSLSN